MELNLTRPIAFFDLETTGINISNDRIVEIAIIKIHPDHSMQKLVHRVNPEIPIPIEASLVHGIYDQDVADKPKFSELAQEIYDFLINCDLGGFNSNNFDIPMLQEEMLRCNLDLEISKRHCVDVQVIYHMHEKRNLESAYAFYCGKTLENAHSAEADILATYEVLKAQLDKYSGEIENNIPAIANKYNFGTHDKYLDSAKRFKRSEKGIEINFGKHKGKTVQEILKIDSGYLKWMYQSDFPLDTKNVIKKLSDELGFNL